MKNQQFSFLPAGAVKLKGPTGAALQKSINNRLKKVNYTHLVDPFRFRNENDGAWRCEFWGKIVRSAILSWYSTQDPELLDIINNTVFDLISTQTADGCISSYPEDKQTEGWDIWGRKYVLLALLRYYNFVHQDEKVKNVCIGVVEHLKTQIGPGLKNILDCGHHEGLAASSILGAIVGVYQITGNREYLKYAEWIVESGCSRKHNIFEEAAKSTAPKDIANGKAYEMMSCFQGLSELYIEDSRPEYYESILKFYEAVRDREIFITGVGGLKDKWGEFWFDGKFKQLRNDAGSLGETCVTTTWIHYCERILRMTKNAKVADELETSLYNGILGAMKPDGSGWIHCNPTPLAGPASKIIADDQIQRGFGTPFDGHDCCQAQGPEALAMAPLLAVLQDSSSIIINFYEDMDVKFSTPAGNDAALKIQGGYPKNSNVKITLKTQKTEKISLLLRIPSWWNQNSELKVDGTLSAAVPGQYFSIEKYLDNQLEVEINFNQTVRIIKEADRCALCWGSIVLAQDSRLGPVDIPLDDFTFTDFEPPEDIYLLKINHNDQKLCDYASTGNQCSADNQLCVWMKFINNSKQKP